MIERRRQKTGQVFCLLLFFIFLYYRLYRFFFCFFLVSLFLTAYSFPPILTSAGMFLSPFLAFYRLIILRLFFYPFTAPDDSPEMMYFWNTRAMMTGGRDASTPAVLVRMKSLPNLLENSVIRTGRVFEVSVEVKFSA